MLSYEMKFDLNDLFDHNDISYSNSSNPNIFDGPSPRIHQEEFQPNIEITNATSGKQNESYVSHSFSLTSINHNIFFCVVSHGLTKNRIFFCFRFSGFHLR